MTRTTLLADRRTSHLYRSQPLQEALEAMWELLERADEVFRMNELSEEVCVLDEDLMQRLMALAPHYFKQRFGTEEVHSPADEAYVWENVPDYLLGTYTIRGRYTTGGHLIPNPRLTYFFSEEV